MYSVRLQLSMHRFWFGASGAVGRCTATTAALLEGIKAAGGCGSRGSVEIKFRAGGHRRG